MRPSLIRSNLANDQVSLVITLHFNDPVVYEMVSQLGPDGIWLDMEHHRHGLETAANLARAARLGKADLLIRPGNGEFTRMSRILEIGAQGIMYPRCQSAEEARRVVEFAKFAPIGKRGFDGGGADNGFCNLPIDQYVEEANRQTFLIIQVEEQSAVDQVEAIAAVDGVDAVMLGPGDFSVLEGIPGQVRHAKVDRAQEKIASAASNQGKHWASIAFSPEHGKELVEQGARILMHGADLLIVKQGVQDLLESFAWRT